MRLHRRADQRETPWKNGGGTTREIAVFPSGAGFDTFDWRLSAAKVAGDGPFSTFPGVDRILTVLEGNGFDLDFGPAGTVHLTPASAPHAFAGDTACTARLIGGAVGDLNLMLRRGRWRATAAWSTDLTGLAPLPPEGLCLAYLAAGAARIGAQRLEPGDTVEIAAGEHAAPPEALAPCRWVVMQLFRVPA